MKLREPSILSVFQVATFQGLIPLFYGLFDSISVVLPVLVVTCMVLALSHFIITHSTNRSNNSSKSKSLLFMKSYPVDYSQKSSSLPPIKLNFQVKRGQQESLSNKLQLYIKFRTSSNITFNSPIESLMPSHLSGRSHSIANPTPADVVMSSKPPRMGQKNTENFKYSRLFEIKQRKEGSFLQKSYKAQELTKNLNKNKKNFHALPCKVERKQVKTVKREDISKKSIPFLSDILNKVCRHGSKVIFSQFGPLESKELLIDIDHDLRINEVDLRLAEEFKTVDTCLQTESDEIVRNKRRVIFNKNSSFSKKKHSKDDSSSSSSEN